tara:strand:+ start:22 stop:1599 length:1578 start_codon:yes stop_codon:yes gene_type:complete
MSIINIYTNISNSYDKYNNNDKYSNNELFLKLQNLDSIYTQKNITKLDALDKYNTSAKELYGEVFTPFNVIDNMIDILPLNIFTNPKYKFLDPGAGRGNISIKIYLKLMSGLENFKKNKQERHDYIIKNMLYLIEIQENNIQYLKYLFGEDANIYKIDYLSYKPNIKFDVIISNPPYNSKGFKKVPTNIKLDKKRDGITIWTQFVYHNFSHLKPKQHLLLIIPSIWMKPDRAGIYNLLTSYQLKNIRCFNASDMNTLFKKQAQTPTSIVYCINIKYKSISNNKSLILYDKIHNTYFDYKYNYPDPIPLANASILNKMQYSDSRIDTDNIFNKSKFESMYDYNILTIKRSNIVKPGTILKTEKQDTFIYPNIRTAKLSCKYKNNKKNVKLVVEWSDKPLAYYNMSKLVLPHKMNGFPILDLKGEYGISNRDNFIFLSSDTNYLKKLEKLFSTYTFILLFDCTRYRMRYLENYIFKLIPNMNNYFSIYKDKDINDTTLASYYNFDKDEIDAINQLRKLNYTFKYIKS